MRQENSVLRSLITLLVHDKVGLKSFSPVIIKLTDDHIRSYLIEASGPWVKGRFSNNSVLTYL